MKTYTYSVTLTQSENIALGAVSENQDSWITNAIHNRCRIAIDDLFLIAVERCMAEGIQVPTSKDEMIVLADQKGWLKSASRPS